MSETTLNRRRLMQLLTLTMAGSAFPGFTAGAQSIATVTMEGLDGPRPLFIPPGGGQKGKIGEGDITFKLDKSQTAGNLGSAEEILLPGHLGAPPHYHKSFDETCIVLEGTVHIMVGEEVFVVPAGGWHLRPRGIVHTFWNSGTTPARFIDLYTPGGHEAYMKDLAKLFEGGKRPKPGELAKLAEVHDIVFAFDKLQGIMDKYKVLL